MRVFAVLCCLVVGSTRIAAAQSAVEDAQPQALDQPTAEKPAAEKPVVDQPAVEKPVVEDRYFGVHLGVNVGLFSADLQVKKFYAYVAAGAGITLLTNNTFGAFAAGGGYTVGFSHGKRGHWQLDLLVMAAPGWVTGGWPMNGASNTRIPYVGVGLGVGFRYEMNSGFSLGFKIPLFGYAISPIMASNSATGVALYYVASGAALPIVSLGYRF